MRIEKIAINASPLIVLGKSGLERLLPELFTRIVVPDSVYSEVVAGQDRAAQVVATASWVERISVTIRTEIAEWDLGPGESEVLSFVLNHPTFRASIDDHLARRCAQSHSLLTLGTAGILLLAQQRGVIPSFKQALQGVIDAELYLSEELIVMLLNEADS